MFRVFATIDQRTSPVQVGNKARRAEAIGYDGISVADGVHDGLLAAAMALDAKSSGPGSARVPRGQTATRTMCS
jgi:hypothetical protein